LQEFQKAAELDPNFALAYVGLADTYAILEEYSGMHASEAMPKARSFAQKALQIDDSLGEANATLGLIYNHGWQWAEAEAEFKKAIELNPNYPTVHHWRSINLRDTGRKDEAFAAIKRAQELDPLSRIIGINVGIIYLNRNDTDAAIKQFQDTMALDPGWWSAHHWLAVAYLKLGRNPEAIAELEKAIELSNRSSWPLAFLGYAYALTGKRTEAVAMQRELEERYPKREAVAVQIAAVLAGLGEKDAALTWVEKGAEDHSGEVPRIIWYPPFDALRGEPRFKAVVRQMGILE
jgi:tetratricopeptide (TPR) repeat protein